MPKIRDTLNKKYRDMGKRFDLDSIAIRFGVLLHDAMK